MLVEDNIDDIELIQLALKAGKKRESNVDIIRDGDAAIKYMRRKHMESEGSALLSYAFVLLDIQLPKKSGLRVLEFIRDELRDIHTPVIMFSSSNNDQEIEESYRLGANSFIRKPIDADQFERVVYGINCYWSALNTTRYDSGLTNKNVPEFPHVN